jgi:hypothetical protein
MSHLHSPAHITESCYTAIRKALFPGGYPRKRSSDGRFVSRKAETTRALRSDLAAQSNVPLADALEAIQLQRGAA